MTLKDYGASLLRTFVPILVGLGLARLGINALDIDGVSLQVVVTTLVTMTYYAGVRALEAKWPKIGILLGWTVAPVYTPPRATGGQISTGQPFLGYDR